MTKPCDLRYFKTNPNIIRITVMIHVRFPLSVRNVENLRDGRDIDVSHKTVC